MEREGKAFPRYASNLLAHVPEHLMGQRKSRGHSRVSRGTGVTATAWREVTAAGGEDLGPNSASRATVRKARASSEAPVVTKPVANTPRIFKHVSCAQRTSFTIYVRTHAENMLEQSNINHGEFITGKPRSIRVSESPGLKGTFTLPHFQPS